MGMVGGDLLLKPSRLTRIALALVVATLLSSCGQRAERVEVTDAAIVGSWSHEFEDGPPATMTLETGGVLRLVDMPRVVFIAHQGGPATTNSDLDERITAVGTWSLATTQSDSRDPGILVTIVEQQDSRVELLADNSHGRIQLYFWYGQFEDELKKLTFDRVD